VLDIPVAKVVLERSGIVPIVGQFVSASVPKHVWMHVERHVGGLTEPLD
jgi:hypothetical protein